MGPDKTECGPSEGQNLGKSAAHPASLTEINYISVRDCPYLHMEQIDELSASVGSAEICRETPAGPKPVSGVPQQQSNEAIPQDDAQAASQLIADLWELSAQHLEARFWPLSYYRNQQYKRLLSDYCEMLPTVQLRENRLYLIPTLMGVRHLREKNLSISSALIRKIKFHIIAGESILYLMRGLFYFVCGASFLSYVSLILIHTMSSSGVNREILNVFLSFGFGLLGSVVSLLNRISEFEQVSTRSQTYLIYTGATSPIVGGIFAAVIAGLLQSKVITFGETDLTDNYWLFMVVGFLSGFSERFSGNLLRIAERRISGPEEERNKTSEASAIGRDTSQGEPTKGKGS
jgi:hypothetical protein